MSLRLARRLLCAVLLLVTLPVSNAAEWVYVVQPGDNPWTITERYLAGVRYWPRLQQYNDIPDPTHIAPGTRLRIPVAWLRRQREPVQVMAVSGDVSVQRPNESARPLELDDALVTGDVLRTAPDGSVELRFGDGSRMYLRGGSELRIQRSERIPQTDDVSTRVQLPRGRSESGVRSMRRGAGRFEIDTPAAVTSVRGTHFRVNAEAADASTEVLEGGVRVANNSGLVEVESRMGTTAVAGRAPAPPTPLLAPPDLSGIPSEFERVPFTFSIPPLPGAARYRLQIAAGPEFATLLYDAVFQSPELRGPALSDGAYHLRVRGIDARQLEGLDSVRSIGINARPEPPFLSEPPPDAQLADGAPTFRWAHATTPGTAYRFQLSDDAAFLRLREDVGTSNAAELRLSESLPPGRYFWRVAAIDPGEGPGPFSDPQSLRVLPPGPALEAPTVSDAEIVFRWRAGGPGASYEFQLARDEKFADVMLTRTVPEAEIKLPRPDAGIYYMRARTFERDGIASAFTGAQRIEIPAQPNYWPLLIIPVVILLVL
jgi:hypothetical protein